MRKTHARTIDAQKNKKELKAILPIRKNSNKFKYVYCFDKELKEKYQKMALPYPTEKDL